MPRPVMREHGVFVDELPAPVPFAYEVAQQHRTQGSQANHEERIVVLLRSVESGSGTLGETEHRIQNGHLDPLTAFFLGSQQSPQPTLWVTLPYTQPRPNLLQAGKQNKCKRVPFL